MDDGDAVIGGYDRVPVERRLRESATERCALWERKFFLDIAVCEWGCWKGVLELCLVGSRIPLDAPRLSPRFWFGSNKKDPHEIRRLAPTTLRLHSEVV